MNDALQQFARQTIKDGLDKLPNDWIDFFKLMYGRDNGKRSVEDTKAMNINEVVDKMDADKLDWAMQQVANSIKKLDKLKNEKISTNSTTSTGGL